MLCLALLSFAQLFDRLMQVTLTRFSALLIPSVRATRPTKTWTVESQQLAAKGRLTARMLSAWVRSTIGHVRSALL